MMKKFFLLLVLFPVLAVAQSDFETKGFSIDAVPSIEIKGLDLIPYHPFDAKQDFFSSISILVPEIAPVVVSSNEYWQPVDMFSAATKDNNFIDSKATGDNPFTTRLNNQFAKPGFNDANRFKVYADDEYSPVQNSVYKNQSMPYYGNPYYGNPYYYNPYYRQSNLTLYRNRGNKSTISIQVNEY
ncbi:hypothetical protein [Marixanthomonas sp. SCSIO 43207]|uniref:hypothetical protein n=1 Tax=Marixanthomonas sp. SCSIO 43207 TaxID=2779360 RepID=UPI001CA9490F|nr:hypothetical protein [Marixanthomonas sp. SCSIO 43207]